MGNNEYKKNKRRSKRRIEVSAWGGVEKIKEEEEEEMEREMKRERERHRTWFSVRVRHLRTISPSRALLSWMVRYS